MIEVRPVTDRRARRLFIDLPYRKYHGHPHWIPPARITEGPQFDPKRNPFFADADMDLFLAWDGPRLVGRVAAIDDHRHNAALGENVAGFGFFEADSAEAAAALLAEVDRWAVARGRTSARGPVSPSLNHVAGLQIDAFDVDPVVMLPYNPPEYIGYVESVGYTKAKDLLCWMLDVDPFPLARWEAIARRTERRYGVVVRSLNRWRLKADTRKLYEVYTQAWEKNWGFVPPSFEDYWHIVRDLRWLWKLSGMLIAEIEGRPVAAITVVPDLNQVLKGTDGRLLPFGWWRFLHLSSLVTRARAVTTGVVPEYRETGILAALISHMIRAARREGFRQIELSWILEDNAAANQTISKAGGRMYKTYRLYEKALPARA